MMKEDGLRDLQMKWMIKKILEEKKVTDLLYLTEQNAKAMREDLEDFKKRNK